jgi:hypothetical protein
MKSASFLAVFVLLFAAEFSLRAEKAPDLENGFKSYGSYDGSHLDTVRLMNGNLVLHAPLLPDYPQRGKFFLTDIHVLNSKTWQVVCQDPVAGVYKFIVCRQSLCPLSCPGKL